MNYQDKKRTQLLSNYDKSSKKAPEKKEVIEKSKDEVKQQPREIENTFSQYLEKSFDGGSKLVQREVIVKKKDGTTYTAKRWVDPNNNDQAHHFGGRYKSEKELRGKTPEEKISNIVNNEHNDFKANADRHRALISMGIYDQPQHGVLLGDALYPKHLQKKELIEHDFSKFHEKPKSDKDGGDDGSGVPKNAEGKIDIHHEDFDINQIKEDVKNKDYEKIKKEQKEQLKKKLNITYKEKWETYNFSLDLIIQTGRPKSLIAYGTGGLGKTWDMEQKLAANNVRVYDEELHLDPEEYDAVVIGGNTSPSDLYNMLYVNKNKLIIFDDCDSMWGDQDAENILKRALDTSGDGTIRYANPKPLEIDEEGKKHYPPRQFKFNGQIIFISNMKRDQLPQPIVDSRARTIDLSMNMDETIDKMENIKDKMRFKDKNDEAIPVTKDEKQVVIDFFKEYKKYIDLNKVNGRTLGNLALYLHSLVKKSGNDKVTPTIKKEFERGASMLLDIA